MWSEVEIKGYHHSNVAMDIISGFHTKKEGVVQSCVIQLRRRCSHPLAFHLACANWYKLTPPCSKSH